MTEIRNLKFFVVDDDKMFSHFLKKELEKLGVEDVKLFAYGIDCINNIEEEPDIILLDYNLNYMNGGEVLCKIMRHNPDIAVIVISDQNKISVAVDIIKQGAFDYLVKSDDLVDGLKTSINKFIKLRNLLIDSDSGFISRILNRFRK